MLKRLVMKYFPLAVLVIFIMAILGMSHYAETRKYEQQENANHVNPPAAVTADEASQRCQKTNKPQNPPSWIDTFTWPDGVTGWALLLTLFIIAWQSVETRDAAQAGFLSAQAVINTERAWVVMVIEQDKEFPRLFRVKAENRGHTPAKIVAASQEWAVVKTAAEMPEQPQYRHGRRFTEGVFLFPGESRLMTEFGREHLRMPPIGYERNGEQDFQTVKCDEGLAIFFGNVVYRDILSPPNDLEHETRWCSLLRLGDTADELALTWGRDGYTKHT
jgi:hypothetical protein